MQNSPRRAGPRRSPRAAAAVLLAAFFAALATATPARAQAIGAHKGDTAGSGGARSVQGRIVSPTGRLPESRVRVTLESTNAGTRTAFADSDGLFNFNNLEPGPYQLTVDAGKDYEISRESVYIGGATLTAAVPVYLRLKPEANPALAGVPKEAVALFLSAHEAARARDTAKAAEQLRRAVALHPQFGLAHNALGELYMREQQLDKALESFAAAEKALPDDYSVQLNYGVALVEKKQFAEGEKRLRRALRKSDKSPSAHLYLGLALVGLKDLDGAEAELKQAARLGGEQMGVAHKYLGGIYWGRKDYKRAADELETYLKMTPKAPDAERLRGTIKELRAKS